MSSLDTHSLIKTALDAVLAGAAIAESTANNLGAQALQNKGSLRDIVTQADLQISELLIERLAATGLPVISEEVPHEGPTPERFWVIDPIDGTVNFSHGLASYAVCAGLVDQDEFRLGVVCAPKLDEFYFTLNSEKALLNGRPFSHQHRPVADALVAASFSAKASTAHYAMFQAVNESTRGCLRTGSAALNVCWAAAGKLQAAYGFDAKLWDVAGALAIARAAGCEVLVKRQPGSLKLDYIVGSREVVQHLAQLASHSNLWSH